MSETARLKATIYVGGLDIGVSERVLTDAFLPFGEIVHVSIPQPDIPSSAEPHRGFGYVEFESPMDAAEAIDNMDQSELFGRVLKVAEAKPQKDSNAGLNSKVAVWEQEGWLSRHAMDEEERPSNGNDNSINNDRPKDAIDLVSTLERSDIAGPQVS